MWCPLDLKISLDLAPLFSVFKRNHPPSSILTALAVFLFLSFLFQYFQMFLSPRSPSYPQRKTHKSLSEWGLWIGKSLISPSVSLQSQACQEWSSLPCHPSKATMKCLSYGHLGLQRVTSNGLPCSSAPLKPDIFHLLGVHGIMSKIWTNGPGDMICCGLGCMHVHVFSQVPTLPIRILHTKIWVSSFSGKIMKIWQFWIITLSQLQSTRTPGQLPRWDQAQASPVTTVPLSQLHSHRLYVWPCGMWPCYPCSVTLWVKTGSAMGIRSRLQAWMASKE